VQGEKACGYRSGGHAPAPRHRKCDSAGEQAFIFRAQGELAALQEISGAQI
jgi:hypothetical protein